MSTIIFNAGDIVEMKKPHPCDRRAVFFDVLRVGADIKIKCRSCGHEVLIQRYKFEKSIKRIIDVL